MYGVVEKSVNELTIFRQQRDLAGLLEVSTATIRRKHHLPCWETEKYIIYNPVNVYLKARDFNKIGNLKAKMW